jgi:hypothetical protein
MVSHELECTQVRAGQAGPPGCTPSQEDRGECSAWLDGDTERVYGGMDARDGVGPRSACRVPAPRDGLSSVVRGTRAVQGSLFGIRAGNLALEDEVSDGAPEGDRPSTKDWISQAIASAFADPDARRGVHYSMYISKLEALNLASQAIAENLHASDIAGDFCDEEGLYGGARSEVLGLVFFEYSWISDFLDRH